jgi:hypothetical protein
MLDSGVGMDSLSAEARRDQADQWADGSQSLWSRAEAITVYLAWSGPRSTVHAKLISRRLTSVEV